MALALAFITLVPLPFAFVGRPLFIIITYTIVGSLFIAFLAATLLYLNTRVAWTTPVPRNHWTMNALLVVVLILFLALGIQEVRHATLLALPGVRDLHELHVWAMASSQTALTAHLVLEAQHDDPDALLRAATRALEERFEIRHVTLQLESTDCPSDGYC